MTEAVAAVSSGSCIRQLFYFFFTTIVLLFALAASCIFNPPDNGNNDNPDDTIIGWEWAGIVSPGDSGQHIDVCHYHDNMFTFNYRGELFYCLYPDFSWSKLSVPNGDRVYCFYCDTINGLLYVSTIECGVYEYSIASRSWRSLVPNNNVWFDSTKLLDGKLYPKLSDFIIKNQALSAEILYFIRKKTIQLIKTYLTERVRNVKEKI